MLKPAFLIVAAGVVGSLLIGYNTLYVPKQQQVRLIEARIGQEQIDQRTAAEVAELLRQVERYRKRLPQEPDPSWIVREVVALSQQTGVQLATVSQQTPQDRTPYTRLAVDIQCRASYHQLGALLDDLEHRDAFLFVDRLEIDESKEQEDQAVVRLTLGTLYIPPLR